MLQAIIFDMDGLMVDTEPIHSQAFAAMLREYGVEPEPGEHGFVQVVGTGNNYARLKELHSIPADIADMKARKRRVHAEILNQGVPVMPGLHQFLDSLSDHPAKKAIASTSFKEHIELVVDQLGIAHHFQTLISGHDLPHHKPAPDIYLEAARQLGVDPAHCVALEDSETGVQAAKAAGMKVIAVPSRYTAKHDFTAADLVVPSLEHLNRGNISRLGVDLGDLGRA